MMFVQVSLEKYCVLLLVLIAGFKVGLAGLNLGYPENALVKPRNPAKLGSLIFSNVWI